MPEDKTNPPLPPEVDLAEAIGKAQKPFQHLAPPLPPEVDFTGKLNVEQRLPYHPAPPLPEDPWKTMEPILGLSWQQFNRDVPAIRIDRSIFIPSVEDVRFTNGNIRTVETFSARDESISAISSQEKYQDSFGIRRRTNGLFDIVVADGVSGTVVPEAAARVSVESALSQLEQVPPTVDIIQRAYESMQRVDLFQLAKSRIQFMRNRVDLEKNPVKAMAIEGKVGQFEALLDKDGGVSATMLVAAQYDKGNSALSFVNRGDTQVVLFHSDGSYTTYTGQESAQIVYNPQAQFQPRNEIVKKLQLQFGDIVLIQTDGLEKVHGVLNELGSFIARNQGLQRQDIKVVDFIKEEIRNNNPDDDLTTVVIYHQ